MLVSHNLSMFTAEQRLKKSWSTAGDIYVGTERIIEGKKCKFRNTSQIENQIAFLGITLLFSEVQSSENLDTIYYYMDLENTGKNDIRFTLDNIELDFDAIKAGERKIITFSLSKSDTVRMNSINNKEEWHEIALHKYMVASNPIYIYLPMKKLIPEEKQPLLPPEGNYKEIQAL